MMSRDVGVRSRRALSAPDPSSARMPPLPRARPPADLKTHSVGVPTYKRYHQHSQAFVRWAAARHGSLQAAFSSPARVGLDLDSYIQHLYDTNKPQSHASNALYGSLFFYPILRDHVTLAKRALNGWQRLEPFRQRPPMPWVIAQVIATRWMLQGHRDYAIALLLGFDCYFRVSELCGIRLSAITSSGTGNARFGGIALPQTKTGENQSVRFRDALIRALFLAFAALRRAAGATMVFPFTARQFRAKLADALASLGMADFRITPHSLRHGGTTRDYLLGLPVADIKLRGRWVSLESLQRYIQVCESLLIQQRVPSEVLRYAASLRLTDDAISPGLEVALRSALLYSSLPCTSASPHRRR
jgi:integrase